MSNSFNFSSGSIDQNDFQFSPSPNIPKRAPPRYAVFNISLDDQTEVDNHLGQQQQQQQQNLIYQQQQQYPQNIDEYGYEQPPIDYRDSGISTASNDLNNSINYGDLIRSTSNITIKATSATECLNIQVLKEHIESVDNFNGDDDDCNGKAATPPPIPRKTTSGIGFGNGVDITTGDTTDNDRNSNRVSKNSTEDLTIDGYCVPKISASENDE